MKKILESKFVLVVISVLLSTTINVIADTLITSDSVSYSNNKTSETTVKGSLDELFNSVDINERLGITDISSIGDGTVSGAISELNTNIDSSVSELNSDKASKKFELIGEGKGANVLSVDFSSYEELHIVVNAPYQNGRYIWTTDINTSWLDESYGYLVLGSAGSDCTIKINKNSININDLSIGTTVLTNNADFVVYAR